MTELKELLGGIAVVIDDEIDDSRANINNLLKQIESQNIPVLTYKSIPPKEVVKNFVNVSFVLLDWQLNQRNGTTEGLTERVVIPQALERYEVVQKVEFIKTLRESCYCPIFIFTDAAVDDVLVALEEEELFNRDETSNIFVQSKAELKGRVKLFNKIESWIEKTPSIYVLKKWENQYNKSKNKLFSSFQDVSPVWPKVMWKNFKSDGVDQSIELTDLISRNLYTRMTPVNFSDAILAKRGTKIPPDELKKVLEGERYIKNEFLDKETISPGDVFKDRGYYYINIRAACDLIPDRSKPDATIDTVELYLLKGTRIGPNKRKQNFKKDYGNFLEIDSQTIVFPIDDGHAIDYRFKVLKVEKWENWKDKRIGKVLSPHIDKIQQKYSLYFHRHGLPRIPDVAIL